MGDVVVVDGVAYDPSDTCYAKLVAVVATFLTLTTIAVSLRFYSKIFLTRNFAADDWFMLISQVGYTWFCIQVFLLVHAGFGVHTVFIPLENLYDCYMWLSTATSVYIGLMVFIKLSVGCFLLRIAFQRRYIYSIYIAMAIVVLWSIPLFFILIFRCKPVDAFWSPWYDGPLDCLPGDVFLAASLNVSVMSILSDWFFAILPMTMIWGMNLSLPKKITIGIVLGMGVAASVATLIRFQYILSLVHSGYVDQLYSAVPALIWTMVEPGIAITAASLVTLRPLLQKFNIAGFGKTSRSSNSGGRVEGAPDTIGGGKKARKNQLPSDLESQDGAIQLSTGTATTATMTDSKAESLKGVAISRSKPVAGDGESEEYMLEGVVQTVEPAVVKDSRHHRDGDPTTDVEAELGKAPNP